MYKFSFVVVLLVCTTFAAKFPSNIKRCKHTAPDFNECLRDAAEATVRTLTKENRELGLSNLEPLEIPALSIGAGTGAVGLVQNYKNIKIYNYSKAKINKFNFDYAKNTIRLDIEFNDDIIYKANYDVNGKILLLPVVGNGECTLILHKTKAVQSFTLSRYERKGRPHFKVESSNVEILPERVSFNFENLFNGDKKLGDTINTVINENWSEIFEDIKHGYQDAIAKVNAQLFGNVLSKFSIADLFE